MKAAWETLPEENVDIYVNLSTKLFVLKWRLDSNEEYTKRTTVVIILMGATGN